MLIDQCLFDRSNPHDDQGLRCRMQTKFLGRAAGGKLRHRDVIAHQTNEFAARLFPELRIRGEYPPGIAGLAGNPNVHRIFRRPIAAHERSQAASPISLPLRSVRRSSEACSRSIRQPGQ